MRNGTLAALAAYTLWGILPIYWKPVERAPAAEILSHRAVWALVVVVILLSVQRQWGWVGRIARKPAILLPFVATTLLLAVNWLIYLWANNNGHIVEVSLGYFINPLFSVLLGVLFLRERMRPGQWAAIGLAFAGVTYLTISYGHLPWIALSLALTFGFYGLMRKTAPLGSVEGLTIETGLMFLPALIYLGYLAARGTGTFGSAGAADLAAPGRRRPGNGDSADPLYQGRPKRAALDPGRPAIRRTDPAIPRGCRDLPRGFFAVADDRVHHHLDGAPAVLARRSRDAQETGCAGDLKRASVRA